jgi:E3 ubiquitin-protein ligase HERC2
VKQGSSQEVLGLGWLAWAAEGGATGPYLMDFFADIGGVQQIACSERCCLILSKAGRVYMLYYTSLSPVSLHTPRKKKAKGKFTYTGTTKTPGALKFRYNGNTKTPGVLKFTYTGTTKTPGVLKFLHGHYQRVWKSHEICNTYTI